MSKPLDDELETRIKKSSNERFVEAIESIERRTAKIESASAKIESALESIARIQAQTAAATERVATSAILRQVFFAMHLWLVFWAVFGIVAGFLYAMLRG